MLVSTRAIASRAAPAAGTCALAAIRHYASSAQARKGLIIGAYASKEENGSPNIAKTAANSVLDSSILNEVEKRLQLTAMKGKQGEVRVLHVPAENLDYTHVAVAGLGEENPASNDGVEARKDNLRTAAAAAAKALRGEEVLDVVVDTLGDAQAVAEGVGLGLYTFDGLKEAKKRAKPVSVAPLGGIDEDWKMGMHLAEAQNLVRDLMETPSNMLTPSLFAERAQSIFKADGHVAVRVHDAAWAREQKMNSFLAVSQGSDEPLKFLELEYTNGVSGTTAPCTLVGKGITFDSGGISIKPSAEMGLMRGDMGGAATVMGAILGLSRMAAVGRFVGVIPLCENMPSGKALKPGDVVTTRAGLTVEVDNTDAEGRLILCDALHYAHEVYKPSAMFSIATLTGAIMIALGEGATGVFTSSDKLWSCLDRAGVVTGDRMWRMPVYKHYSAQIESHIADINNVGGREAGACTAAAFLRHFVKMDDYAHLDIAGVMHSKGQKPGMACPYLGKGMQGRPTRALIQACLDWSAKQH